MIRNTLKNTKESTFIVYKKDRFPFPNGTGFFISANGYFITANHVVENLNIGDLTEALERPNPDLEGSGPMFIHVKNSKVINKWPKFDLALLKADFEENKESFFFKERDGFPYLEIDYSNLEEGTPVYAFGYPLSGSNIKEINVQDKGSFFIGTNTISTRVTSAIISSTTEYFGPAWYPSLPKFYVVDKALNYGNSGGPIILSENGKVISVCVRFQEQQMKVSDIVIPSLYGITSSLKNIQNEIQKIIENN